MGFLRSRTTLVGAVAALLTGLGAGLVTACGRAAPERPNLVLLISDDQDNEHLGFVDERIRHTPTLDRLARAGTIFPVVHTPARCRSSLASLLSGLHPHQSGVTSNRVTGELSGEGSLPARLREAGYATFLGGKYWEGDPARMGFDAPAEPDIDFVREGQEELFRFLEREAGRGPFFVFWAPNMPHLPHDAPPEVHARIDPLAIPIPEWFDGQVEIFREFEHDLMAMEAWLDDGVAELVSKLEELGELERTLFCFLIDNGYSNGLISKGSPFEKGVATPAFLTWPGHVAPGVREELATSVDLYATLLDYGGVTGDTRAGRTLRPLLEGAVHEPREALYGASYPRTAWASDPARDALSLYARDRRWKYILFLKDVPAGMWEITRATPLGRHERSRGEEHLFDLRADPYELADLSRDPAHRARMDRMREDALDWWSRTGGGTLDLP